MDHKRWEDILVEMETGEGNRIHVIKKGERQSTLMVGKRLQGGNRKGKLRST